MHRTTATATTAPRGRLTAAATALLLTLGALLGLSPAPAGAAPVYHSSEEWAWLEHPGQVIPGGRIINVDGDGACSTGFLVGHGSRRFILTAGHCGDVGDRFAVDDARGNTAWAGQMVESAYERVGGVDIGLIELTGTAPAEATPPVEEPLLGWAGADWLERTRPTICRLGYRTGLSCGDYLGVDESGIVHYEAITDHGDSGGMVVALADGGMYAIAVTSYQQPHDATRAAAMLVEPAMAHWDLTLLS
ncbi:hypothetical protein [Corynebacterium sphenisci]|uniref:hypothetical protein n=1 Tax=Corynebacterium sphenisci TaxID=191493 RepID=UPI0026E0BEC4|nr:hypothetical protein [Corynebacterium sphenisci]MDO5730990.1 hypothetical protein [Corynebacterium sphenisci]